MNYWIAKQFYLSEDRIDISAISIGIFASLQHYEAFVWQAYPTTLQLTAQSLAIERKQFHRHF
jgi:hypothetical protein